MTDEGFGRNLNKLSGWGDTFVGVGAFPLRSVTLSDAKDRVTFAFDGGPDVVYKVEGDCCSHSWIEHLEVPDDIAGELIVGVMDARMGRKEPDYDKDEYDCLQVYNTRFRTAKGDIVLEYRNSSNGYYGGYLVRVDHDSE